MEFNYEFTQSSTIGNSSPPVQSQKSEPDIVNELDHIIKARKQIAMDEGLILEKAFQSNDPDVIMKANSVWEDVQKRQASGTKSHVVDPNQWSDAVGYKSKLFTISYGTLRRMAKTPVINAIISTRQSQVSAFSAPQKGKYSTGFVIQKKPEYYSSEEAKTTKAEEAKINEITKFLLNGGTASNSWHGDTFDSFLKKIVKDSLTLDQATFEIVRNRGGIPVEYLAVDGATFRIADSVDDDDYEKTGMGTKKEKKHGYYPSFVQIIDGTIRNEYFPWELCFGIRNNTTDIFSNGYGISEVEELITIITYMLFSDAYNGKFFSQGSSPKGMLKVNQGVNRNRLNDFRQQWMSMVAGVENAWKIPIIEADKMEWIDLQKNNTDMQFGQWQEYLIKIACAIFKIDPSEVGFNLGNASGGGAMFESSNEAKIKYSRDKGLKPLLKSIEFWINKWIINAIDEDYEFKFVGMDIDSESDEVDLTTKQVNAFMGFKEARRKHNLPEELEEGDFILNPQYTQVMQQREMAEGQEQNGEAMDNMWDDLDADDQEMVKGMADNHIDNPMMADAIKMLTDED